MRDHPDERPNWWETILMKDQTDERPPWQETTLMRDNSDERQPRQETTQIKDQTDKRPYWWETKLMWEHPVERPNWCQNTLLKDQTDVRTPWWETTLIRLPRWETTLRKDHPDEWPSWHESTLIRPPRWETILTRDHTDVRPPLSKYPFSETVLYIFLNKPTLTKVHISLKISAWSMGSEVITKWNIPTWNKHANGKSSSYKTVRFTSGGSRCSEQSALAATCWGGTPPVWTASLWHSRTVGQVASPQFHCRKRFETK